MLLFPGYSKTSTMGFARYETTSLIRFKSQTFLAHRRELDQKSSGVSVVENIGFVKEEPLDEWTWASYNTVPG